MVRSLATLCLAFFLVGCGASYLADTSPDQRIYAIDGTYKAILEVAVAYKEACEKRPKSQRARCSTMIAEIRVIDRRYAQIRSRIDEIGANDRDLQIIEAVIAELRSAMALAEMQEGR